MRDKERKAMFAKLGKIPKKRLRQTERIAKMEENLENEEPKILFRHREKFSFHNPGEESESFVPRQRKKMMQNELQE